MTLSITLTMAAAAALINVWLMIRVGQMRRAHSVSVGDGGNDGVIRRMRAHANFVESTPIVLILIAAIEMTGGSDLWLLLTGWAYMLGRIAHGLGMDGGRFGRGRMIGTTVTMLVLIGLAGVALFISYRAFGGPTA